MNNMKQILDIELEYKIVDNMEYMQYNYVNIVRQIQQGKYSKVQQQSSNIKFLHNNNAFNHNLVIGYQQVDKGVIECIIKRIKVQSRVSDRNRSEITSNKVQQVFNQAQIKYILLSYIEQQSQLVKFLIQGLNLQIVQSLKLQLIEVLYGQIRQQSKIDVKLNKSSSNQQNKVNRNQQIVKAQIQQVNQQLETVEQSDKQRIIQIQLLLVNGTYKISNSYDSYDSYGSYDSYQSNNRYVIPRLNIELQKIVLVVNKQSQILNRAILISSIIISQQKQKKQRNNIIQQYVIISIHPQISQHKIDQSCKKITRSKMISYQQKLKIEDIKANYLQDSYYIYEMIRKQVIYYFIISFISLSSATFQLILMIFLIIAQYQVLIIILQFIPQCSLIINNQLYLISIIFLDLSSNNQDILAVPLNEVILIEKLTKQNKDLMIWKQHLKIENHSKQQL
ncbi:hypothetical protein pb186bvf_006075 [Paramecium bursaria]